MSIKQKIKIINKVEKIAIDLREKYANKSLALDELNKLSNSLNDLITHLKGLDKLNANYDAKETNAYVEAVNLHVDILQSLIEQKDYLKLRNGISAIKMSLKFHPTKHSYFTFIIDWFIEWIYFI